MAETSHRNDPDWKDLADPVPLDSIDPESRAPAVPEDLPGSRSEMLPREESEALARMADAAPEAPAAPADADAPVAPRVVKPEDTDFFGFPHLVRTTEPTLFDTSRSSLQEAGTPVPEASAPAPADWDENEAALQERLRKWMEDARARSQAADGDPEGRRKEVSPTVQRLMELRKTMDPGAGSEPTLAESPEAQARRDAARMPAAPPAPADPMATIMVPADQFLGALGTLGLPPSAPEGQRNPPPRKTFQRPAQAGPRPMTREEALTRKVALLRRNAEGPEEGPAPLRLDPSEDKTLIAAAVALLAVIFVLALGLFTATQAGMFDGLESRFEFLRPKVSGEFAPAGVPTRGTPSGPKAEAAAPSTEPAAPAGSGDLFVRTHLQSAAKRDASNLLSLYGRYARRFPGLAGEVRMQLTVNPNGIIVGGSVTSSTTGVGEFDKAVLLRVREWRLREFPGTSPRIVSYPLLFPLRGL